MSNFIEIAPRPMDEHDDDDDDDNGESVVRRQGEILPVFRLPVCFHDLIALSRFILFAETRA